MENHETVVKILKRGQSPEIVERACQRLLQEVANSAIKKTSKALQAQNASVKVRAWFNKREDTGEKWRPWKIFKAKTIAYLKCICYKTTKHLRKTISYLQTNLMVVVGWSEGVFLHQNLDDLQQLMEPRVLLSYRIPHGVLLSISFWLVA